MRTPDERLDKLSRPAPKATYRLVRGAHLELVPGCALLFSEPHQQVHRLNASGAVAASRLQREATWDDLVSELREAGADADAAAEWATELLGQLADAALLETECVPGARTVASSTGLEVAGVTFRLDFQSDELFRSIAGAYVFLESLTGRPDHTYSLAEDGDFVSLKKDNGPTHVARRAAVAVRLKAAILEDVLSAHDQAAALHAACNLRSDGAFLLLGSPGAGKTTLSLALLRHDLGFGSDDVTLVMPGGNLQIIPLPVAVKESAWDKVGELGFRLEAIPIQRRPDGQRVCFYPIPAASFDAPLRARAIVRLRRAAGCAPAIHTISPEEALVALFEESRSSTGRCSPVIMNALAEIVREADCFDLHYAEAADAASLLAGFGL